MEPVVLRVRDRDIYLYISICISSDLLFHEFGGYSQVLGSISRAHIYIFLRGVASGFTTGSPDKTTGFLGSERGLVVNYII